MRNFIFAAMLAAASVHAEPVMVDGPRTFRLLDSECSAELAIEALKKRDAISPAKRADVTIYGTFVPACWALDPDGDVIVMDRDGESGVVIYRSSFEMDKPDI
jgi:hypothetical protein